MHHVKIARGSALSALTAPVFEDSSREPSLRSFQWLLRKRCTDCEQCFGWRGEQSCCHINQPQDARGYAGARIGLSSAVIISNRTTWTCNSGEGIISLRGLTSTLLQRPDLFLRVITSGILTFLFLSSHIDIHVHFQVCPCNCRTCKALRYAHHPKVLL